MVYKSMNTRAAFHGLTFKFFAIVPDRCFGERHRKHVVYKSMNTRTAFHGLTFKFFAIVPDRCFGERHREHVAHSP